MKLSTAWTRTGLAAAVAGALALAVAGPAAAHVTVQAPGAAQKGFAALDFRVPNERDDASTTKVEVNFPAKQPLAYVSVKPHPGWTYEVTKSALAEPIVDDDGNKTTEAVSRITWTAADGGIKPGEYDDFSVSAGFLPEAPEMVFTALQTYSNGEVVKWIEPSTGAAEPEHPAPVLKLAAASAEGDHHATADPTADAAAASGDHADGGHDDSGALGSWLGGIALVVALVAAGLAAVAVRRRPTSA